jgi:hypothetical protein
MAYTYYYGVECAKCGSFIPVNSYTAEQPGGKTDVTLDADMKCDACQHERHYRAADVVFSKSRTVVVPLDLQHAAYRV